MAKKNKITCREGRQLAPASDARILAFPAPAHSDGVDILVNRLYEGEAERQGRCVSEWANPMDIAILAALLLPHPAGALDARIGSAVCKGRETEVRFWRKARNLLVAITAGEALPDAD